MGFVCDSPDIAPRLSQPTSRGEPLDCGGASRPLDGPELTILAKQNARLEGTSPL